MESNLADVLCMGASANDATMDSPRLATEVAGETQSGVFRPSEVVSLLAAQMDVMELADGYVAASAGGVGEGIAGSDIIFSTSVCCMDEGITSHDAEVAYDVDEAGIEMIEMGDVLAGNVSPKRGVGTADVCAVGLDPVDRCAIYLGTGPLDGHVFSRVAKLSKIAGVAGFVLDPVEERAVSSGAEPLDGCGIMRVEETARIAGVADDVSITGTNFEWKCVSQCVISCAANVTFSAAPKCEAPSIKRSINLLQSLGDNLPPKINDPLGDNGISVGPSILGAPPSGPATKGVWGPSRKPNAWVKPAHVPIALANRKNTRDSNGDVIPYDVGLTAKHWCGLLMSLGLPSWWTLIVANGVGAPTPEFASVSLRILLYRRACGSKV